MVIIIIHILIRFFFVLNFHRLKMITESSLYLPSPSRLASLCWLLLAHALLVWQLQQL